MMTNWVYADEEHERVMTVLEEIDDEKRTYTHNVLEGEMMDNYYKTWREGPEIIPEAENCCIPKLEIMSQDPEVTETLP